MVGALPLEDALNKRNIARGMCFFCSMELEHNKQWFHVIMPGSCSQFMLRAKVFIWRVMVGALPLGCIKQKKHY